MARGLTRDQIGVTEEMILTYGERIWELSHNIQVRRGDPVRELDWAQIDAQRHGRGMADVEIAEEIGLTRDQVLYIRLVLERRRFRRENYHRLYELGGGRRFRHERYVPHEHRFGFRSEAIELRKALEFDPRTAGSYLRLGYWTADTVSTWLQRRAKEQPDHVAIGKADGALSYAQVREQTTRLANAFIELGLRRGDVIAVQLDNTPEFLLAYFASCMMGGVPLILPTACRGQELETVLRGTSARAVLCHAASPDYDAPTTMLNLGLKLRPLDHIVVLSDNPPEGTASFWELVGGGADTPIEVQPVASDPALLCLGENGGIVLHNYHTLLSNSRIAAPIYGLAAGDTVLSTISFSDPIGLAAVNLALHAGATVHAAHGDWAAAVGQSKPSVLFAEARQLEVLDAAGLFDGPDLGSIQKAAVFGGSGSEELLGRLDQALANGVVARGWGAAEPLMVLHTPFDSPAPVRLQTLGTAIGSFAVRMASPTGELAAPGALGEMQVRGCSLFAGYLGGREANREAFTPDGWFRTGQMATTDDSGNVRIAAAGHSAKAAVSSSAQSDAAAS